MSKENRMGLDLNQLQQARARNQAMIAQLHLNLAEQLYVPLAQEKIRRVIAKVDEERAAGNPEAGKHVDITFVPEMNLSMVAAEVFLTRMGVIQKPAKEEGEQDAPAEEKKSPILTA